MYLKSADQLFPSNVDAQTSYITLCCIDIGQLFPLEHGWLIHNKWIFVKVRLRGVKPANSVSGAFV